MESQPLKQAMTRHAAHSIADLLGWQIDAGAHLMFSTKLSGFLIAPEAQAMLVPISVGNEFRVAERAQKEMRCDLIFVAIEPDTKIRLSIFPMAATSRHYGYALAVRSTGEMRLVPVFEPAPVFQVSNQGIRPSANLTSMSLAERAADIERADRALAHRMITAKT